MIVQTQPDPAVTPTAVGSDTEISVADVECFLVHEAALLDEWKLDEWMRLVDEDIQYLIPSLSRPDGSSSDTLFIIADNIVTLRSRVKHLMMRTAWAESPYSQTCRMITNFRILEQDPSEVSVAANFAIWRAQGEKNEVFTGSYRHILRKSERGLTFKVRKALLNHERRLPQGKISFIL